MQQHDVVGMPEAAAAPNWSSAGDRSSGAQASFICAQYHHNANTLEVWVKLQIFFKKIHNPFFKKASSPSAEHRGACVLLGAAR